MPNNDIVFFKDVKGQVDTAAGADRMLSMGELVTLDAIKNATSEQLDSLSNMVGKDIKNYISILSTGPNSLESPNQALSMAGNERGTSKSYSSSHFRSDSNNESNKAA